MRLDHFHEMSTCKGPKKFTNYAQKLAYIGSVLILILIFLIENHIRLRSFKISAMTVGWRFSKKKLVKSS